MTIVHISSSLGGGGAEQMVLQLAKSSTPHIKTIVFSISDDNTLEPRFKEYDIDYHFLSITSFRNSSLKRGLKTMHHIIKDETQVVFHCHQFHGAALGMLYSTFFKKAPIIFTLHSSTIEIHIRKFVLFLTKGLRKKDIIFSNNAKLWYLKNSVVIPNGVDFKALSIATTRNTDNHEPFSFLFLGRLSDEKNPLYMISAAKQLIEHGITNVVFDVVGDGQLKDQLDNEIEASGLSSYFRLHGFQNNIKPFLKSANALILPSNWEGMPMVLIEAAAAKLPIIATPVGSIPDFLNQNNAYVSPLQSFHESMINCLQNYNAALQKSDVLYNELKKVYNIDEVYQAHLKLYQLVSKTPNSIS
ncbi:glycosyltransferase [Psychroserpens sp. SPM9]|uniref:glycosyltransferase n=1 Tax=Psychroserpens sp. SPM9 TaxID=2975598 RepID=UPI0021A8586C|nr:glycosyltransferase [Psychroserpens sp. SPM9]MDG5491654.1 glycosyltransferase [Psychroserpens sp. SPM9]